MKTICLKIANVAKRGDEHNVSSLNKLYYVIVIIFVDGIEKMLQIKK